MCRMMIRREQSSRQKGRKERMDDMTRRKGERKEYEPQGKTDDENVRGKDEMNE